MAEPLEQLVYEARFLSNDKRPPVTVQITMPKRLGVSKWECKLMILGVGDDRPKSCPGCDSLQCIRIASEYARRCLEPLNVEEEEGKSPPELLFPRTIDISWGLEFQIYLERMVDLEVAKLMVKIAERRKRQESEE